MVKIKQFELTVDCGEPISERTFENFIDWIGNVADDLFNGRIFVIKVVNYD